MTRIIKESYRCANCGTLLFRPILVSDSTFIDGSPHNPPIPAVFLCETCGYVGSDLSLPPSEAELSILQSEDYRTFLAHTFRYEQPIYFLMGYFCFAKKDYSNSAYWLCLAEEDKGLFKMDQGFRKRIDEELSEQWGLGLDLLCFYDDKDELSRCYIREWIFLSSQHFPFVKETSASLFLYIVDAMRRNGHFREAIEAVELRKKSLHEGDDLAALEKQRDLCEKEDAFMVMDLAPLC
ncbi:MAG: hypothetical protein SPL80_02485 [Bacilli bacterium]|nr:hypothetical protein [Bacilli bacterium]